MMTITIIKTRFIILEFIKNINITGMETDI